MILRSDLLQARSFALDSGGPQPRPLSKDLSPSTERLIKRGELSMSSELQKIIDYHEATKHRPEAMAPGPGQMDWANEPEAFRRYKGASLIELERNEPTLEDEPFYDPALLEGSVLPSSLNFSTVSQLFFDSMAISAWRRAGQKPWALRVNPSSGNLHPTESYLICGAVEGLAKTPMVCHYAPREHALEVRAEFSFDAWQDLTAFLPKGTILVGLSSIPWRESWKYGERAFRYLQLNAGHAIAALSFASASLGWKATILDGTSTEDLALLFGLLDFGEVEVEPEVPDCLMAIYPQNETVADKVTSFRLSQSAISRFSDLSWQGRPNQLSPEHLKWPLLNEAIKTTTKPRTEGSTIEMQRAEVPRAKMPRIEEQTSSGLIPNISLRKVIRDRRSAIVMDGTTSIERSVFYRILEGVVPGGKYPFNALSWPPNVDLAIFVHRVLGLEQGLYFLVRDPKMAESGMVPKSKMRSDFEWSRPKGSPPGFYRLFSGDFRKLARMVSCNQNIVSDGCFTLAMISKFKEPLERFGPWFYNRLLWECGMIGQALYLGAEATGLNGCGIGCYFDDIVHSALGLDGISRQSLYHFSIGKALPLRKIEMLPAYPAPE